MHICNAIDAAKAARNGDDDDIGIACNDISQCNTSIECWKNTTSQRKVRATIGKANDYFRDKNEIKLIMCRQ